jgi:hypothetical protein
VDCRPGWCHRAGRGKPRQRASCICRVILARMSPCTPECLPADWSARLRPGQSAFNPPSASVCMPGTRNSSLSDTSHCPILPYADNGGVAHFDPGVQRAPSITTRRGRRPAARSGSPPICLAYTWRGPSTDPGVPGLAASARSSRLAGQVQLCLLADRADRPATHLKPAAAFRIPASTAKLRHPTAAAIGHLHTDKTVPPHGPRP